MIKVCLLYGGPSAEHAVSCLSAATICRALEGEAVEVVPVGIDKRGEWFAQREAMYEGAGLAVGDGDRVWLKPAGGLFAEGAPIEVDVAFPIIHGAFGEDGTLQAILEQCGVPYVGADQLASAIGRHKLLSKMVWERRGLPVVDYCEWREGDGNGDGGVSEELDAFVERCGYPLIVKPSRSGSSLGVRKAHDAAQLREALGYAAQFDDCVLCERAVVGREIEFAVLDGEDGEAMVSEAGEIITEREFYDYDAKYVHVENATLKAPAELKPALKRDMQDVARAAYRAIGCRDLARVDMLLDESGDYYLNEINTLPGFTGQSMFPMLWEAGGYPLPAVLLALIGRAMRRGKEAMRRGTEKGVCV